VRSGDDDGARTLADAPVAAEQIAASFRLRRTLFRRSGIENFETAAWHNPDTFDIDALAPLDGPDRWVTGIKAGGQLWLGTYAEVETAARALEQRRADAEPGNRGRAQGVRRRSRVTPTSEGDPMTSDANRTLASSRFGRIDGVELEALRERLRRGGVLAEELEDDYGIPRRWARLLEGSARRNPHE